MPFNFSLSALFLKFGFGFNSTQQNVWNKLPKAPPAPSILDDPKIRSHVSKQDINLSTVLINSSEKFKAQFACQNKSRAPKLVRSNLNVVTKTHTMVDTPPQPPHLSDSAPNCRESMPEVVEHIRTTSHGASTDLIDKDDSPTVSSIAHSTEKESDKTDSSLSGNSDKEADDGESSTTKSNGSTSATVTTKSSPDFNRSDWEPLRALPDSNFHKILSQHVGGSVETAHDDCQFCEEFEGGYNYVRLCNVLTGPNAGEGWLHASSEFGTIKFIHERTKCPVPEVIAHSDTLQNDLGAPYILMKACAGVRAVEVWFGADDDGDWDDEENDFPSAALAAKRLRMLRSLARAMAELRNLEFDKISALDFDNVSTNGMPTIGSAWLWERDPDCPEDMFTEKALSEKPVYDSSLEFFMDGLEGVWPREGKDGRLLAMHQILDTFYRSDAFSKPIELGCNKETFVLRHDDLNLQNILCDPETGEVTAIIDWERASTAPHCLGYAALPIWLISDWGPDYNAYCDPHSPLSLLSYRKVYADAMIEATGEDGDGKYTYKSAMYHAGYATLFGSHVGGNVSYLVRRLLHEVPGLHHTDLEQYLTWLGYHWEAVGSSIKQAIRKIAKPVARTDDCNCEAC